MINFIFKNVGIKILCVVVASALWVFAVSGENRTDFFPGKIPIEPQNVSKNLAPVYDINEAQIKVMAAGSVWRQLSTDSFKASVDLKDLSIGTREVEVKITSSVPGVKIIESSPTKVLVRMEPVATKRVLVKTQIEGNPADGYEIGDAQVKPLQVEARGANSVIDDLTSATAAINLDSSASSFEDDVKLIAYNVDGKAMRFISFSPEFIHVTIPIIKQSGGRILGVRANIDGSPSSGFWISKIQVEPTTVVAVGDSDRLKSLDYLETEKIDVSGISKTREYQVGYKLPSGIEIATSEAKNVKVKVSVTSVVSEREVIAGVSYIGLAEGLRVTSLSPNVIKVMTSGIFGALGTLSSDNVVVNLDLSGKKAGSYRVTINSGDISVPPGVSVSSYVPSAVTVRLK